MNARNYFLSSIAILVCTIGLNLAWANMNSSGALADNEPEFSKPTIDLGCVVSDIDASVKFYTEALGFKEASSFKVGADYAGKVGLTDNKALDVKVMQLGSGEGATQLKLMQIDAESAKSANDHIHSTLGFSYLTIYVASTGKALARLKAAGVETVAESPLPIEGAEQITLTIVRDPDGNLIELIGPTDNK